MREQWIIGICIIILAALTLLYPSVGWFGRATLFRHSDTTTEYAELVRKNQSLEAALAVAQSLGDQHANQFEGEKAVSVFSRYPLNFKNELLVNAGENQGVRVGDIAIVPVSSSTMGMPGVFLGKVSQTFSNTSLVQTVFDSSFESAARIGSGGIDTFLEGGNTPKATLIQRRAGVKEGQIVYVASPNLPYGLPAGTIAAITPSADNVFDEASLSFGYDINQITTVHLVPAASIH